MPCVCVCVCVCVVVCGENCALCAGEEEGLPEDGGEEEEEEEGEGEEGEEKPKPPPKSTWKPPATVPSERPKTGANKKTYFVCYQREYWGSGCVDHR